MAAPLLSLALSVVAQQGRHSAQQAARRWRRKALLWGLIGLLALSTYGAVLVALALALTDSLGPLGAALALAGGTASLALCVIAALLICERRDRRQAAASRQAWSLIGSSLAAALPTPVQRRPLTALFGTAAMAYLVSLWLRPGCPQNSGPPQNKD